jgi:hypothetical protein
MLGGVQYVAVAGGMKNPIVLRQRTGLGRNFITPGSAEAVSLGFGPLLPAADTVMPATKPVFRCF